MNNRVVQSPNKYGRSFFRDLESGSSQSAAVILQILADLFDVRSMIDIGCGSAAWLRVANENLGVTRDRLLGVDGSYSSQFHDPAVANFLYQDLANPMETRNIGCFDLAVCLEVAEHLPEGRADSLVAELANLSALVLFSAAIPGQGGTGHVNEQWPDYWIKKFARHGYRFADAIRPIVWNDPRVSPWYAQNTFLAIRANRTTPAQDTAFSYLSAEDWRLRIVHPAIYRVAACESASVRRLARALPSRLVSAAKNILRI